VTPTILWHAAPEQDVARMLQAVPEGLSSREAQVRLARYGPNRLPAAAGPSAASLLLEQVRSPLRSASSRTGSWCSPWSC
jgi:cation-transporting ATPase F